MFAYDYEEWKRVCSRVAPQQARRRGFELRGDSLDEAVQEMTVWLWEHTEHVFETIWDAARAAWGCVWRRVLPLDARKRVESLDVTYDDGELMFEPASEDEYQDEALVIQEIAESVNETGQEIIQAIAGGVAATEIAEKIGVSVRTAQRLFSSVREIIRSALLGLAVFVPPALRPAPKAEVEPEPVSICEVAPQFNYIPQQHQNQEKDEKGRKMGEKWEKPILAALFLFGIVYNEFVANLKRSGKDRGYTAILVALGSAINIIASIALIGPRAAWKVFLCFSASGLPMTVGDIGRYMDERRAAEDDLLSQAWRALHGDG